MSNFILIPSFQKILPFLVKEFNLPEIIFKLSIFSFKNNKELHIHFFNRMCTLQIITKNTPNKSCINISNKNIKYLFKYFVDLGFTGANINSVQVLKFGCHNESLFFYKNSYIGPFIELETSLIQNKVILNLVNKFNLKIINSSEIKLLSDKNKPKIENIIDRYRVLNPKILLYCDASWHRIRSESKSLKNRLKSKSNDYSQLEDIFYQITGNYLLSKLSKINQNLFNPVSIVISAYNSENTVIKTLYSIESQNLTTKNKQKIQVILVDDGSKNKLVNFIKNYEKEFTFILHIIRSESNQGLSGARNLGFSQALHKHIIFLDADILLTKNYLFDHSIRSSCIPNAVFSSLRKNIDTDSKITNIGFIRKGLNNPEQVDDSRIVKNVLNNNIGMDYAEEDRSLELLNDTNLNHLDLSNMDIMA